MQHNPHHPEEQGFVNFNEVKKQLGLRRRTTLKPAYLNDDIAEKEVKVWYHYCSFNNDG